MFKKILALALVLSMALFMVPAQAEEAESTFPAIAKEDLKIGMIYVGDTSDGGYNYVHDSALMQAVKELGMNEDQVIKKTNVPEDATCETALRELVEAGCQIIFADSFGHMYYMEPIAEEYPEIIFSHCSGFINNGVNMNNYFGRIYEPRFLSGLAAGLRTQTNKIGYVSAMNNPECNGGLDAFTLGVRTVNPDATVYVKYTNTWYDPTIERQTADALIDMGCDVIAQHQDSTMPQVAAQEKGVWGCGYNADMTSAAPDAHLCAPIWNWSVVYKTELENVINGTWKCENYYRGMQEGMVGLSELTKNCVEGTQEVVDEWTAKIMDGSFDVFDGEIKDNTGAVRVAEGERLTDAEITSIDWLVEGVVVA